MLGDRLRELRKQSGQTQVQLAVAFNMSRSTYAQYEVDRRKPDYNVLKMFADYFKVSTDYLLGVSNDLVPPIKTKEKPQVPDDGLAPPVKPQEPGDDFNAPLNLRDPSAEEYVLSSNTLANAALRMSGLLATNRINEDEFLALAKKAYIRFTNNSNT